MALAFFLICGSQEVATINSLLVEVGLFKVLLQILSGSTYEVTRNFEEISAILWKILKTY